jgi:hypothetical protein
MAASPPAFVPHCSSAAGRVCKSNSPEERVTRGAKFSVLLFLERLLVLWLIAWLLIAAAFLFVVLALFGSGRRCLCKYLAGARELGAVGQLQLVFAQLLEMLKDHVIIHRITVPGKVRALHQVGQHLGEGLAHSGVFHLSAFLDEPFYGFSIMPVPDIA